MGSRRASPALKERAAEIYGFRPEFPIPKDSIDETVAQIALNTLLEATRSIPQWEKKLNVLQAQEQDTAQKALGLMADGASQTAVSRAMKEYERLGDRAAIVERRIRSCQGSSAMVEQTLLIIPEIATAFQRLLTETLHDAEGNQDLRPEEQAAYAFVAEKYGEEIA